MQLTEQRRRWARAGLLPVGFAVAVLCLGAARVGDQPYWMDEAATRRFVDRDFVGMLRLMWAQEGGMGPYFAALWTWTKVFSGDSGARMLSVIGGAVAAAALVAVARRWFDTKIALVAGALFVTNPFFLRYLTELRAYSWLMAVSIVFGWAVVEYLDSPSSRRAVSAGIAAGLGMALHYPFVLWAVAVVAVLVAARLIQPVHLADAATAAVVALAVVLPFLHVIFVRSGQIDWISKPTARDIVIVGRAFVGGNLIGPVLMAGLVAAVALLVSTRRSSAGVTAPALVIVAMAVLAPVGLVAVSFIKPLLILRYLSPGVPFVILGAAWGFVELGRSELIGRWRWGPLVGACAIAGCAFVWWGPFSDESRGSDPRATVEFVLEQIEPGDIVVIDRPTEAILHYLGPRPDIDPGWAGPQGKSQYYPRHQVAEFAAELRSAGRVFVFLWVEDSPSEPVAELLDGRSTEIHHFGRSVLLIAD